MRVKIGPYKNWFGPYQLAEALCFWVKETPDEFGNPTKPEWVYKFGEWLAHGSSPDESHLPKSLRFNAERPETWLYKLLQWIDSKRKRTIKIHIDRWDTWNMDRTLALIILPMLKQLNGTKHGAPCVDDADVPEHLRSTVAPPKENEYDVDAFHFDRWDWVLKEMIWAFEQHQPDCDWEQQYYSGKHDVYWKVSSEDDNGKATMYEMMKGPDNTWKIDMEGLKAHQDRITNGFRLFGKYYQNLWD